MDQEHVCGLQGWADGSDDVCPACEQRRVDARYVGQISPDVAKLIDIASRGGVIGGGSSNLKPSGEFVV